MTTDPNEDAMTTGSKVKLEYVPTGEHRPPHAGEWFRSYNGVEQRARFDFSVQSFDILREVLTSEGRADV